MALVLRQSLQFGSREGLKVALTPLLTDLPIVAVALVIAGQAAGYERFFAFIAVIGGFYIIYLGAETLRTGPLGFESETAGAKSLQKGVLANLLNPHPYLFWLTVGGPIVTTLYREHGPLGAVAFLLPFYSLLVGSKVSVALFAGSTRAWLTGRGYTLVLRSLGAVLVAFGLRILVGAIPRALPFLAAG
jgi:threonine/homoserine/homoserine lactone efflux protein